MAALASAASAGESKDDPILGKKFNVKEIEKTGQQIIDELLEKPVFVDDDYVLSEYFSNTSVVEEAYDDFLSLYAYYVNELDDIKINEIDKDRRESRRESLEVKIHSHLEAIDEKNVTTRKKNPFSNVTGRSQARQKALNKKIYWERALKRLSDIENSKKDKKNNVTVPAAKVRLRFNLF